MIIGITGISGAGKTTLTNTICSFGNFYKVNIDDMAHELLDKEYVQKFIKKELDIDVSSTNRKELAEIIFTDRHKSKAVSDYMWELIRTRLLVILNSHDNVIIDWILLPHTEFFKRCDIKILVKPVSTEIRNKKVCERDNISLSDLNVRDSASISYNENDFDYVIKNNFKTEVINENN